MKGLTATLVYNPNSGKKRATNLALKFQKMWKKKTGTTPRMRATTSREDIRKATAECAEQSDVMVLLGGDGTFSEGLQGLFEHFDFKKPTRPIGLLPAGTGNSFLRDFGIEDFDSAIHALFQSLENKKSEDIDIGVLQYEHNNKKHRRIIMNIWGIGFIPAVTKLAVRLRLLGALNYTAATLAKVIVHKPYTYDAMIDGKPEDVCCDFITISNSQYTGGKMQIAPPARTNDSRLFLVLPQLRKPHKVLTLFPRIFKGDHLENPLVRSQFIKEFSIKTHGEISMNIDGELETGKNPSIKVFPLAWKAWITHV